MTETKAKKIELIIKIVGLLVAVFGVVAYFLDRAAANDNLRRSATLDLVSKAHSEELRLARNVFFEFWARNDSLASQVANHSLTPREYYAVTYPELSAATQNQEFRTALLLQSEFFEEVKFCVDSGVCDIAFSMDAFCPSVRTFWYSYAPAIRHMRTKSGFSQIGIAAQEFVVLCDNS